MAQPRNDGPIIIHAPSWDDGEDIYLRPVKSFGVALKAQTAALSIPEGVDPSTLSPDALMGMIDSVKATSNMLYGMIDHWTLRYAPTAEQEAAGLQGDPYPLTPENVAGLLEEDGTFLQNEVDKLGKSVKAQLPPAPAGAPIELPFRDAGDVPAETGVPAQG